MNKPHVTIFTDGACSGNPGPGGWGAILRANDLEREINGRDNLTTNNQMELMAAISALEALKKPSVVDLTTDSQYVVKGITNWIYGWKRNGWKNAEKQPVKNADLWQRLDQAAARHEVQWHWVKGHAGHAENERADELAREAIAGRIVSSDYEAPQQTYLINQLVNSVRLCLEAKNWDGALFTALLLPDICSQIEAPSENPRRRYERWWDEYLPRVLQGGNEPAFSFYGRDVYAIRWNMLRDRQDDVVAYHGRELIVNVRIVLPPRSGSTHRKRQNSTFVLQVDIFCEEICAAVNSWFNEVKNEQVIQKRMMSLSVIENDAKTSGRLQTD